MKVHRDKTFWSTEHDSLCAVQGEDTVTPARRHVVVPLQHLPGYWLLHHIAVKQLLLVAGKHHLPHHLVQYLQTQC